MHRRTTRRSRLQSACCLDFGFCMELTELGFVQNALESRQSSVDYTGSYDKQGPLQPRKHSTAAGFIVLWGQECRWGAPRQRQGLACWGYRCG